MCETAYLDYLWAQAKVRVPLSFTDATQTAALWILPCLLKEDRNFLIVNSDDHVSTYFLNLVFLFKKKLYEKELFSHFVIATQHTKNHIFCALHISTKVCN